MFSKACEYGIRAVLYLATRGQDQSNMSQKEISRQVGSPEAFTGKILQKLKKSGIVKSIKGNSGGFCVDYSKLDEIRLIEIVDAIDGPQAYSGCIMGLSQCSDSKPCPIHHQYKSIKQDMIKMISNIKLSEMVRDEDSRKIYFHLQSNQQ